MEFEEIQAICSQFGFYNIIIIALVAALNCYGALHNLASNFLSAHSEHWCRVPPLEYLSGEEQRRLAIPWDSEREAYETCRMYNIDWANVSNEELVSWNHTNHADADIIDCQYGWSFDHSVFQSTIQTQWSLVCDDAWLMDLVGPTYVAGFWLGSSIAGFLTNKFGRKQITLLAASGAVCFGCAAALSPNAYIYLAARFCMAVSFILIGIAGSTLLMELTPQKYRRLASLIYQSSYSVGAFLLAGFGYLIRDFRQLAFTTSVIGIIFITYIWAVPRSPQWLIWKRDLAGAVEELVRIAKRNRTPLPSELLEESYQRKVVQVQHSKAEKTKILEEDDDEATSAGGYSAIFRTPVLLLYVLAFTLIWLNVNFTYSGVSFNIDGLFGDVYLNMIISGALEVPSLFFGYFCLNRLGRRMPIIILSAASATSAALAILILSLDLHELDMVTTICALFCRSCVNGCWMCTSVLAVEVFPTSVRNYAISMANAISYLVTIAAPFIAGTLTEFFKPLPYVIFVVLSMASAWSAYILPETQNRPLPESVEDLINRRKTQKSGSDTTVRSVTETSDGVDNQAFVAGDLEKGEPVEKPPLHLTSSASSTRMKHVSANQNRRLSEPELLSATSCALPGSVCHVNLTIITDSTYL